MLGIGLYHPVHSENVGHVLRSADAFGASIVAIEGDLVGRIGSCATDVTRAIFRVPVLRGNLRNSIPFACIPIAVERADDAVSLVDFEHPKRAFYVFGPENSGLGWKVRSWCKATVKIPSFISLNLAAAVNIVLYDRAAKGLRGIYDPPMLPKPERICER